MDGAVKTDRGHQTHIGQTHKRLFEQGIWTKSMLQKYKRCPEEFYQEFVLGIEPVPTWHMRLGNSMGDLMEEWGKRHLRGEKLPTADAMAFLANRWAENMKGLEPPEEAEDPLVYKSRFITLYDKFKAGPANNLGKLEAVEAPFGYDGQTKLGDVAIAGHPDQVWEGAVVDIKTRKHDARVLRMKLDWSMERVIYGVLTGKEVAGYMNLIHGGPAGTRIEWKPITITPAHVDIVTEEVNSIVDAVKKGSFPAVHEVGNYPCVSKWCFHYGKCRKTKGVK